MYLRTLSRKERQLLFFSDHPEGEKGTLCSRKLCLLRTSGLALQLWAKHLLVIHL